MTDYQWASTRGGRAAIAAVTLSGLLFFWTLAGAVRAETLPSIAAAEYNSSAALAAPPQSAPADVDAAVEADLFATDRSAPPQGYRMPGEQIDEVVPKEAPVLPVVLGTAFADATHSFATVQLGESHSVIMRVGDKIGEYTIQTIERGRVVFTNAARKKLEITELKP